MPRWKDLPQREKIERVRSAFGAIPNGEPSENYHHYGIHIGYDIPLGRMLSRVVTLGPDVVHVSPISNHRFLALWKIPEGERLLNP